MTSLITALRTLTIIPVPGKDAMRLDRAPPFFPLVGAVLSLIPLGIRWWAERAVVMDMFVPAVIALGLVTWLTGALHVDGLGDVADAFGGGRERERVLAILKDSRMGSFGVTAIVFDLLLKAALWRLAFELHAAMVIACSLMLARCAQGLLLVFMPNARGEGLTIPYAGKERKNRVAVIAATGATLLVCGLATSPFRCAVMAIAAGGVVLPLARWYRGRIGGITGDCIGAANETIEIAVLVAGLLFM